MALSYNFKKGIDIPNWVWMRQFPGGNSNPGTALVWDGSQFIYFLVQVGTSTAGSASTTQLWRFDTYSNGYQFLASATNGNQGMDMEYDSVRNVLFLITGNALTSWQVYNLNTTSVSIMGQSFPAYTLTTVTSPVLPAGASTGATIEIAGDNTFLTSPNTETGLTASGGTATTITYASNYFTPAYVGMQVNFSPSTTTVALQGKSYIISSVAAATLTTSASMAASPVLGDTFTLSVPYGTSTGANTSTTLNDTTASNPWATNQYANWDVLITGGTGAGQRRRIGSNTSSALTLAATVAGSATATGSWSVTPDATSTYRIIPSNDFAYYLSGGGTATAWKIDLSATTGAFSALTAVPATVASGANIIYSASTPGYILILRGGGSAGYYWYNIGTNAFVTPTIFAGGESLNTGSGTTLLRGKNKLFGTVSSSQRNFIIDLATNIYQPAPQSMYEAPTANDGKRVKYVRTPDGVEWVYQIRSGGQEVNRIAVEWL